MRIGVDLDGPCANFVESLARYLRSRGRAATVESWQQHYCGYRGWGLTDDEFLGWCHRAADDGELFTNIDPEPGVVPALERLRDAGHTIHIVTARNFGSVGASEAATMSWLARHRVPLHSLTFSSDKTVVPTDVFIEDNLGNYDALEGAGCEPWLVTLPHNPDADGRTRRRVPDLPAFVDMVLAR